MSGLERLSDKVFRRKLRQASPLPHRVDLDEKSSAHRRPGTPSRNWFDQPGRALDVLSVVVTFGILALLLVDLNSQHRSEIAAAEHSAQGFAEVLAEHTARTFEAVDRTLRVAETIRADIEAGRTTRSAQQALGQLRQNSPILAAIEWTNATGDIMAYAGDGDQTRANIADTPYFIAQRAATANTLFISPPFRSTATGQWVTAVSLPLRAPDGRFSGIVAAQVDQSYFARIYRSIKPGANGSVTLTRRDGQVLTREPFNAELIGRSVGDDEIFTKHLPLAEVGVVQKKSPLDGIDRIAAYCVVPQLPLVMLVTYDRADALRLWYEHIQTMVPLVAMLIGVILIGTSMLSGRTRQLARQTALLKATLDNMDQGLIVVDDKQRLAICNPRAMQLLDLPASLIATQPLAEDVIAYQAARGEFINAPEYLQARQLPRPFSDADIWDRKRPDGTIIETQTVPFGDRSAVITYKDVTKQKQGERELRDGEARYRLLAEAAADMIFQVNQDFVRVYVSPSSREILGYAPEEMIGRKTLTIIHPEDADRVTAAFQSVIGGVERTSVVNRSRHRDGRWIWVESALRLIRDPDTGAPSGILGALRDISVRKTAEAEAVAARLLAEEAAAAQSQFLATMSHELRTPLNSVLGFAGLILDRKDLAPDIERQVRLIETASSSLLMVVNDILDFSKIEEGMLELASTRFSLTALIDNSVSIIRGTATNKNLRVEAAIEPGIPPFLVGDDGRLRQILLNLLNNAIKFTREGHVVLAVQREGLSEAGHRLRFVVSDTGIGIPKGKLDRLFKRFSQVDGSTSREFGGSGLGLAICKRLVDIMGGKIGVESVLGKGSTFWFSVTLPAAAQADAVVAMTRTEADQVKPCHILLVEDVEVNQEIASSILRAAGHTVDIVSDGADAILEVQSTAYDVVLMDIQMPGMDGVTATRRIRALAGPASRVPIVAMTANVLPQQVEAFRAAGMNDHVGKPFKREDLFAAIKRCLAAPAPDELSPRVAPKNTVAAVEPRLSTEKVASLPADPDRQTAVCNAETFESMTALLGREKVDRLLAQLETQLKGSFANKPGSVEERLPLAREAHKLISSAGMLGFLDLSRSCAKLEAVLNSGEEVTECFEEVREACQQALTAIAVKMNRPGDLLKSA
jgi:PAS domain S-box-containing protein